MKHLIIKILFYLFDKMSYNKVRTDEIEEWLANQYEVKGCKLYLSERQKELKDIIASGLSELDYREYVGMVKENQRLWSNIKLAYLKQQEVIKKKQNSFNKSVAA